MVKKINRQGSTLMTVMIMLIVAAIIAMQMMPDQQTINLRERERFYNSDLSQLREAIDLVKLASKDPNSLAYYANEGGWKDFLASDTSASISAKIASLSVWGFLRMSDLRDRSVPEFKWGSDNIDKLYWKVSTNYATNTSFEIISESDNTWIKSWEKDSSVSSSVAKNVRLNSIAIDEYPFQNKLGDSTRGENSIQMIRIDK